MKSRVQYMFFFEKNDFTTKKKWLKVPGSVICLQIFTLSRKIQAFV